MVVSILQIYMHGIISSLFSKQPPAFFLSLTIYWCQVYKKMFYKQTLSATFSLDWCKIFWHWCRQFNECRCLAAVVRANARPPQSHHISKSFGPHLMPKIRHHRQVIFYIFGIFGSMPKPAEQGRTEQLCEPTELSINNDDVSHCFPWTLPRGFAEAHFRGSFGGTRKIMNEAFTKLKLKSTLVRSTNLWARGQRDTAEKDNGWVG